MNSVDKASNSENDESNHGVENLELNHGISKSDVSANDGQHKRKQKKCRRSLVGRNRNMEVVVVYANIQGFRGKKTSLINVMETTKADVVMLTETMVKNVSINGCQCINPKVSTGQNVSIVLASKCCTSQKKMKLYEPNESINMMGIRLEFNNTGIRLYTAHLKQQSANSRDDIKIQFEEIKNQFRSSNMGREPMLLICDANVHVGGQVIDGCDDVQDWGGKELIHMLGEEGLIFVKSRRCDGIITRPDVVIDSIFRDQTADVNIVVKKLLE